MSDPRADSTAASLYRVPRRLIRGMRRVRRRHRQRRPPAGSPPGTVRVDPEAERCRLSTYAWCPDTETFIHEAGIDLPRVRELRAAHERIWLRVVGLGGLSDLTEIAEEFGIHPLELEDVASGEHRAKLESWPDHMFVVMRMVDPEGARAFGELETSQISIFMGEEFLLTIEERSSHVLDPLVGRLTHAESRLRHRGAGYLGYAVLDTVLDHYFPALEPRVVALEALEDELLDEDGPQGDLIREVHPIKSDLLSLRRAVWPLRDVATHLMRTRDADFGFDEDLVPFLRDWTDDVMRLLESIDQARETADGLIDMFMSLSQHRMNEVINLLTIISTIFIPLSFITGLYGMNFDPHESPWNMPELDWDYGYPAALGFMALVAIGLLWMFKRWGWLRRSAPSRRKRRTGA